MPPQIHSPVNIKNCMLPLSRTEDSVEQSIQRKSQNKKGWKPSLLFLFFLRFYLFIFRERGREGEREETSMCGCLSHSLYWDLARNPGMRPEWESNRPTLWLVGQCSIH